MVRILTVAMAALLLSSCAQAPKEPPGNSEYRPNPYLSSVTVTGNDVPGPLVIREASVWLGEGEETLKVNVGDRVDATFNAWVNGHGEFVGRWMRDGDVIDRVSAFITYGETLRITLNGPTVFPTTHPGRYEVRFEIDQPQTDFELPVLYYQVADPYR